jgi:methyl-accepting chemotaxis protein
MKKAIIISVCAMVLLFVIYMAYAQMGESKSRSMMGSQGHMEGMVQGHDLKDGIMHQMGQMSRLMQQMRDMMAENSDAESMNRMSGIIKEMSEHIEEMSRIMNKGNATKEEMKVLEDHNLNMQKKYEMMRW